MKGRLYACDWLQDPIAGDYPGHEPRPIVVSRSRALWVPDAGILFQWPMPQGAVQVTERDSFPPTADTVRTVLLGEYVVPYPVIQRARRYLRRLAHIHAQEAVLQQAVDRLTREAKTAEYQMQSALATYDVLPA